MNHCLEKNIMKNIKISFRLSTMLILGVMIYTAYYLLLKDNVLHSSISSIIAYSHHVALKKHLLILGLLPIYIAAMIFGAVILGLYLDTQLGNLVFYYNRNK